MVLPRVDNFRELVVKKAHLSVGHLGSASTINAVRSACWIPRLGVLVKKVISSCTVCCRHLDQNIIFLQLLRILIFGMLFVDSSFVILPQDSVWVTINLLLYLFSWLAIPILGF